MTAADELDDGDAPHAPGTQRIDKWLWFARIIKSRTLAAQLVTEGKVRINRAKAVKPSQSVRAGDVLTVTIRGRVDLFKVLAPGERRGPPEEARKLYEVLTPPGTGNPRPSPVRSSKEKDQERDQARSAKRDRQS